MDDYGVVAREARRVAWGEDSSGGIEKGDIYYCVSPNACPWKENGGDRGEVNELHFPRSRRRWTHSSLFLLSLSRATLTALCSLFHSLLSHLHCKPTTSPSHPFVLSLFALSSPAHVSSPFSFTSAQHSTSSSSPVFSLTHWDSLSPPPKLYLQLSPANASCFFTAKTTTFALLRRRRSGLRSLGLRKRSGNSWRLKMKIISGEGERGWGGWRRK